MFVYDVLMEFIKHEDHCIIGPANVAKEKLEKLAMVNSTTKISGYESQFKVCSTNKYLAVYVANT